ncbi:MULTISPECIES: hypothetical protein [unclassified Mycolicibacterium]|uniref:hypothetical protein n=1 Tax=unclassified Mycolicibacterium TaxID=2636767 RepID=UPI001F4C0171|nr:hypothetical protein [Mycolicibacterium sp. YH-1]UNB50860.1 hypothetical protein L0M16_23335 [Mycolicibacterium sp. YH-1]
MIVTLHLAEDGSTKLAARDSDDLTSLSVDGLSSDPMALERASGTSPTAETVSHVMLDVECMRAVGSRSSEWDADFTAMIAYARSRGWVSDDGRYVRAHVT